MSHADDRWDHKGPHPALVGEINRRFGIGTGRLTVLEGPAAPDWRHPGPRIIGAEYPERAECTF